LILINEDDKMGKITTMYIKINKLNNKIVNLFSSVQLTMILLALIIIASAVGTFIRIVDTYRSWWFILLLSLFWLNLFICTIKRLKLWRTKLPSVLTHLGLLTILAGALITSLFGERGFLIVYKGYRQDTFIKRDGTFKELDFKLRLDDFSIEWEDSGAKGLSSAAHIKTFKSKITILENDMPVFVRTIEVNRPLTYKGYGFYQASYDREGLRWTGLDVVKDPAGAPVVFSGFIVLNIGIILSLYLGQKNRDKGGNK
jgi:hypothetical protein